MFKSLIIIGNKFFGADNSRIRKIASAVPEPTGPADFKIFFAFFYNNFCINDLGLHLVRTVDCTGFIDIPEVSSDPLFWECYGTFLIIVVNTIPLD